MGQSMKPFLYGGVLGAPIYQAEKQRKEQRNAMKRQEKVQAQQLAAAGAEQRRAQAEERMKNQKAPEVAGLLARAQEDSVTGAASTILTGAGARGTRQKRGRGGASLLGE